MTTMTKLKTLLAILLLIGEILSIGAATYFGAQDDTAKMIGFLLWAIIFHLGASGTGKK